MKKRLRCAVLYVALRLAIATVAVLSLAGVAVAVSSRRNR
jgi:hypothetical protein